MRPADRPAPPCADARHEAPTVPIATEPGDQARPADGPRAGAPTPAPNPLARLSAGLERWALPRERREVSLRAEVILLLIVLVLAGLAARAQADTLHVGTPRPVNGGLEVRVRATAPSGSDYAAGLYAGRCPRTPADTDAYTPITRAASTLYVWPSEGETGALNLCVWIWRASESATALTQRHVRISAGATPEPLSPLVNSHPLLWLVLGWLATIATVLFPTGWLAFIALCAVILARTLRGRAGRRRRRRDEQAGIARLQDLAATDAPQPGSEASTEHVGAERQPSSPCPEPPDRHADNGPDGGGMGGGW